MLTGISLTIVGVWVIVQALAGGLAIRLRQAVTSPLGYTKEPPPRISGGGTRTPTPATVTPIFGSGGSRESVL